MNTFKVFSVVGVVCLSLAIIAYTTGLATNKWVVTTVSIDVKDLYSKLGEESVTKEVSKLLNLRYLFGKTRYVAILKSMTVTAEISSGLNQICLSVKLKTDAIDEDLLKIINHQIEMKAKTVLNCHSTSYLRYIWQRYKLQLHLLVAAVLPTLSRQVKKVDHLLDGLDNVKACTIVAAAFAGLALMASFAKIPCLNFSKKQWIVVITVSCAVIAAISSTVSVAIMKKRYRLQNDIEEIAVSGLAYLQNDDPKLHDTYASIYNIIKISEENGFSLILVCLGIVLVILGIIVNVGELLTARNSKHLGYI